MAFACFAAIAEALADAMSMLLKKSFFLWSGMRHTKKLEEYGMRWYLIPKGVVIKHICNNRNGPGR
jgi:hypothetical protein